MYPFWDLAIQPVLEASAARCIVEIGALKGETTVRMLDGLGPAVELHVIDPLPGFDPAEHERRFPGRYLFHRDISLNVLDRLPAMDVALVDGDHNWYTVYHELTTLRDVARREGKPAPIFIVHDVGWPYGRRDLYYEPARIPAEHRQPYERRGILRGQDELAESGGANAENCNAIHEGGPRNGVMTAVDDYIAEHDRPVRLVVLAAYHGLAIVVDEDVISAHPALAAVLDQLESSDGRAALVELAEAQRLDMMVEYHSVFYGAGARITAMTRQQLDLLAAVAVVARDAGGAVANRALAFDDVEPLLDELRTAGVFGHLVVCGPAARADAIYLRGYLAAHELELRIVVAVDPDRPAAALKAFARPPFVDGRVRHLRVPYEGMAGELPDGPVAFLWIAVTEPASASTIVDALHDRLADGALVVIEGADGAEVRRGTATASLSARG